MRQILTVLLIVFGFVSAARALGPHEVLLLVNGTVPDSVEIARYYAELRSIPESNIVRLSVPPGSELTVEQFTELVWEPARGAARKRGIDDHILAWVYSAGFPYRIKTEPAMSIQGLTFTRTRVPDARVLKLGLYKTPLFAGMANPNMSGHSPMTLDSYSDWLGSDLPVPSMMLGYTGERGNTVDVVKDCLKRGVASDSTHPTGTVYYVTSTDIRSRCRQWQYLGVVNELSVLGVAVEIVDKYPAMKRGVMGIMMGSESVPRAQGMTFAPGGVADHLTSWAAAFDNGSQDKISAWIDMGATATAGTVTEPYALAQKFQNAWFYVCYASGCTVLESYAQSIRCPLQILLIGDPLATPWAPKAELALHGLDMPLISGTVTITATVEAAPCDIFSNFLYLLDGKVVGRGAELQFDTTKHADGRHRLRAVAKQTGMLRHQVFAEREIVIAN